LRRRFFSGWTAQVSWVVLLAFRAVAISESLPCAATLIIF